MTQLSPRLSRLVRIPARSHFRSPFSQSLSTLSVQVLSVITGGQHDVYIYTHGMARHHQRVHAIFDCYLFPILVRAAIQQYQYRPREDAPSDGFGVLLNGLQSLNDNDGPCGMTRSHVHPTTINDDLTSNEVQDCLGGMPLHADIND